MLILSPASQDRKATGLANVYAGSLPSKSVFITIFHTALKFNVCLNLLHRLSHTCGPMAGWRPHIYGTDMVVQGT